jgi:hypothetical protein
LVYNEKTVSSVKTPDLFLEEGYSKRWQSQLQGGNMGGEQG